MRKFVTLLAALVLCFALCISAAAYNASEITTTSNPTSGTAEGTYRGKTVTAEVYPAGTTFAATKDVPGKYFSEFQIYNANGDYVDYIIGAGTFTLPDDGQVYCLSVFDGSSFVFYDTYVTSGSAAAVEPEAPLYTKYQYNTYSDRVFLQDCYIITGTSTEAPQAKTIAENTFTGTFSELINGYICAVELDPDSTIGSPYGGSTYATYFKWNGSYFEKIGADWLPSGEHAAKEAFVYNGQTVDMLIPDSFDAVFCITLKGSKFDAAPETPAEPAAPAEPVKSFTDIAEGETFYDAIAYVTKQGLMDGTTDTAFQRKAAATNQAVLDTIGKLTGADAAKEWAAQKGLADDAEATREDLVTMLWIAGGKQTADESVLAKFADAAAISAEAKTAMAWAVETGLIQGYANGCLGAQSQLTRGAMAAILFRAAA